MLSNRQMRSTGRAILEYGPLPALKGFHKSQAKYRWLFGGNRSGKSEGNIGFDLCSYALGVHPYRMTPIIFQPWLERRIEALPDTDAIFYADLNDNRKNRGGYVDDKEIDLMIAEWPEDVQQTRVKGHFAAFLGAVYKTFNRDTHVVEPTTDAKLAQADLSWIVATQAVNSQSKSCKCLIMTDVASRAKATCRLTCRFE